MQMGGNSRNFLFLKWQKKVWFSNVENKVNQREMAPQIARKKVKRISTKRLEKKGKR